MADSMRHVWSTKADEILSVGHPLEEIGVRNWALSRSQALVAIEELAAEGIPILGSMSTSDLERRSGRGMDWWYCDREPGEPIEAFAERSSARGRDYLIRYPEAMSGDELLFAIVPG